MIRFGGSYNLRESEGKHSNGRKVSLNAANSNGVDNGQTQFITCSVFFLDDTEHNFQVPKNAVGEELLEKVYDFLELVECDYFGLQYVCVTGSNTVRLKWLDTKKSIKRQMVCAPFHLFFRLKFYVSEPAKLIDEYTRHLVYLQLRKDLLDGRLPCNEELAAILGSFAVQAEFGDFTPDDNSYLKVLRLVPSQPSSLLRRIRELHALRLEQTPSQAQLHFLQKAKCLDFYGFDLYEAKDGCDRPITIGVNANGVSVFDQGARVHTFPWSTIIKLSFKRKNFYLQIMTADENVDRLDTELSFNAISALNCKMLWKACIEHHTFFRLLSPPETNSKSLFHLGSRFRYSGRTMHQTIEESRKRADSKKRPFQRKDQKPPIPPQTTDSSRNTNGDTSKHGSVSSIVRSPSISSNSISSSNQKTSKNGNEKEENDEKPKNRTATKSVTVASRQYPIRRRTSSLVRATLLRRKISQLNTSATSFLNSIFTNNASNNNSTALSSPSFSNETEESQPDSGSTILSTSKASSSAGSEVPPDPRTASTSSDELKLEIVELSLNEEPQIDDEQTIRDADQTVKEEQLEEANSSSDSEYATSGDESESLTPSKKAQRHSAIYTALPSSILQQPPAEYHPQSNRSQASPNPALTTSLQSLSLDKATHSIESALTDDEGASSTIRRSWNAVPLTPQPGHARQHFRLNSPSPYDSASLILNNSLASSNVARNRNNVYSMSDDEGSGNSRVWYPLSGVRNEEAQPRNGSQYRPRANVVPLTPNTHRRSQQNPLVNGYGSYNSDLVSNGSSSSILLNNNSILSTNGHYTRPPVPLIHSEQPLNGAIRRTNAYVTMNGTDFPASINMANVYVPNNYSNRRSINGVYVDHHSPATNTSSSNGSTRVVSAPNGIPSNYNSSNTRLNGSMSDLPNGITSSPHYAKRVNSTLNQPQPPSVQPQRPPSSSPSSLTGEDASVVVKIQPDGQGRFGFNITGGVDCSHPVIISRIIAGSAADRCFPRLNEGDQVLKINGQNISQWSYGNVVNFIRSLRTYGEMTLTIKPNVYRCVELDEPENHQYIMPETQHVAETVPRSDKLAQSLVLLKESLETDAIVKQFEQLYRKKPGMSLECSQLPNNVRKNRYRDVRPYDATRVVLNRAPSGDYINANHINMEIPASGIINSYIACQGPLSNTSGDFWYMVWEQGTTVIIMLTTLLEKGRQKCHQYWPDQKESVEFGQLIITNLDEREERYAHYRELSIRNKMTREERRVTQIQYVAWPDHGVPENRKHFIDFVSEVRRARNGSLDPIVVHCSAGIGRTGVLILMETAACLIESNEPVYPLDIVRVMRDQRPMMIQTPEQFTFTCECIMRAYTDGVLKPLAEYNNKAN